MPAAQATQPAALVVPGLVTEPENPGAQAEQGETEVLLVAPPAVVMPAGQDVQVEALEAPTAVE